MSPLEAWEVEYLRFRRVLEEFRMVDSRQHFGENLCCVRVWGRDCLFRSVFKRFCSVESFRLELVFGSVPERVYFQSNFVP